ncbi:hypothetical protein BKA61DRAFT_664176 [Leptodontidium sp. MPI-SDFR-AT-0119]|nr:hypothetical protein BKA61DRAFT_664176 [Leptodontidium sp. MPI-SDFR-AT-0119]
MSAHHTTTGAQGVPKAPTQNIDKDTSVGEGDAVKDLGAMNALERIIDEVKRITQSTYYLGVLFGLVSILVALIIGLSIAKAKANGNGNGNEGNFIMFHQVLSNLKITLLGGNVTIPRNYMNDDDDDVSCSLGI